MTEEIEQGIELPNLDESLDLDELGEIPDDTDEPKDMAEVFSDFVEAAITPQEPKRKGRYMPFKSFLDQCKVQKAPEGLIDISSGGKRTSPLRFPLATIAVGECFPVDQISKSIMRRSLIADTRKLRKIAGQEHKRFKIMQDQHRNMFCVRTD